MRLLAFDISPFFKSPARSGRWILFEKRFSVSYAIEGHVMAVTFWRVAGPSMLSVILVRDTGHIVFFKSHSQIFLLAENISFLLSSTTA